MLALERSPKHYELCDGLIYEKPMQEFRHQFACAALQEVFVNRVPKPFHARANPTVRISGNTVLDPNLAIQKRSTAELGRIPTADDVEVIFEVGDSSVDYDRNDKKAAYAEANIPVYWLFDMPAGQLLVHTDPKDGDYAKVRTYRREDEIELPLTGERVKVGMFFPEK